jgi:hypothetical protein
MSKYTHVLIFMGILGGGVQASAQKYRDPNNPDRTRSQVSRAERESLGLANKDWEGVLHPDVLKTFERTKENDVDPLGWIRFPDTVYVQVHLNVDGAASKKVIRGVQARVLDELKAAEFQLMHRFQSRAGLIGHASEEAIAKLAKHRDVLGICLDNQPLPMHPPVVFEDEFSSSGTGKFADEPGLRNGVDVKVYQALEQSDRVYVLVSFKGDDLPDLTHVPGELGQRLRERKRVVRAVQNRILSKVTANEFWLWNRLRDLAPGFYGYVNRAGMEKLWKDPLVVGICLEGRIFVPSPGPCSAQPEPESVTTRKERD